MECHLERKRSPDQAQCVMYKNRNITDFFKPFALPRSSKRPRLHDDAESTIVAAQPYTNIADKNDARCGSPRADSSHSIRPTSSLTSLASGDGDTSPFASSGLTKDAKTTQKGHDIMYGIGLSSSSLTSLESSDGSPSPIDAAEPAESPSKAQRIYEVPNTGEGPELPGALVTSSQRIVKNGEIVIRNSDDETDSATSLDDIDDLLMGRKPPPPGSSQPIQIDASIVRQERIAGTENEKLSHKIRERDSNKTANTSSTLPVIPKYKFSLDTLAVQAEQYVAAEASAARAQLLAGALDRQDEAQGGAQEHDPEGINTIDTEFVTSVMSRRTAVEDFERLINALKRTEALDRAKTWSFFDHDFSTRFYEPPEFPIFKDPQGWQEMLNYIPDRQEAFLNGYVGEVADKGMLPDEILSWAIDATCMERSQDLRVAYTWTLSCSSNQVRPLLTADRIKKIFRLLGAHAGALDIEKPILPTVQEARENGAYDDWWPRLRSVLYLIESTAEWLDMDSSTHAICMLCRLLLDYTVVNSNDLVGAIGDALASLLGTIPEETFDKQLLAVLNKVYPCVTDPRLRLQMLRYIPPVSLRLNLLRRHLALAYSFEDSHYLKGNLQDLTDFSRIAELLRRPQFHIHNRTDYSALAAFIATLDISLDDGHPSTTILDISVEDDFDRDVDQLATIINEKYTQILETGASHVTRTQAKDVLGAFKSRLEYAVRTKQKPKKLLFASQVSNRTDPVKDFLAHFRAGSEPEVN